MFYNSWNYLLSYNENELRGKSKKLERKFDAKIKKVVVYSYFVALCACKFTIFINGNISNGNLIYSDSTKFILDHEESIMSEIVTHLKDEGKSVDSVKLLPNTARGEYYNGDMGGHYHIYFSAYVNDNPKQSLNVELYFPDAIIHAFTVVHPNPYKNKKKMKRWFIGDIKISDDPSWDGL